MTATRVVTVPAHEERSFYRALAVKPPFGFAIVARDTIDLNGNQLSIDSSDSQNPAASTAGMYDPLKTRDGGSVRAFGGVTNTASSAGSLHVYGALTVGSNAAIQLGPLGAVGSRSWHQSNAGGIEPGWLQFETNSSIPSVVPPFTGGYLVPTGGSYGGVVYAYVLGSGNYQIHELDLSYRRAVVTGDAVLYVTGHIFVSGRGSITITEGSRLRLYGRGATVLAGNGVINSNSASAFVYYGLPGNFVDIVAPTKGCIYAPNARVRLAATTFSGALVCDSLAVFTNTAVHYDQALQSFLRL